MAEETPAQTLHALQSELAVRNLVARYSDAVNRRDEAAWANTWAEDGVWCIVGMQARGRAEVVALWNKLMQGFPLVVQMPGECIVQVQGASAQCRAYLTESIKQPDGSALLSLGVYHDTIRCCADGQWRFARREFHAMYSGPPNLSAPAAGYAPPQHPQQRGEM